MNSKTQDFLDQYMIDELKWHMKTAWDTVLSGGHPEDIDAYMGVYKACGVLLEHYGEPTTWRDMRYNG